MVDEQMDIVLSDPALESAGLYRYTRFLDKHPVRVSIPVVPGFRKAVVVAAALQFEVRLNAGQPEAAAVPELMGCLDFYLNDRTVRQPIEFFHSSLYALHHGTGITLWDIHERPPVPDAMQQPECRSCEYRHHCKGFFKYPRPDYPCDGVKALLAKLTEAAADLKGVRVGRGQ